jgi:hypothetical protein
MSMSVFIVPLVPMDKSKEIVGCAQAELNFSYSIMEAMDPIEIYAFLPLCEKIKHESKYMTKIYNIG